MYVKPLHDHVPDPERGGYLAVEGREVEANTYWVRRIADGDVEEAEAPLERAAPPAPPDPVANATPDTLQSPPTAGSSISEPPIPQPRTARKGA